VSPDLEHPVPLGRATVQPAGRTFSFAAIRLGPLVGVFAALMLTGLWGFAVHEVQRDAEQTYANVTRNASDLAHAFAEHSSRTLQAADLIAQFLKAEAEENGLGYNFSRYLSDPVFRGNLFNGVYVVAADGNMMFSSVQPFDRMNLAEHDHIKVHLQRDSGRLFIGMPVRDPVSGKSSMQLTRRINLPDGAVRGVVGISLDPLHFASLYEDFNLPEGATVTLVGDDGVVRAGKAANERAESTAAGGDLLLRARNEQSGNMRTTGPDNDVERIFAFRHLPDYPLHVVVGIPVDAVESMIDGPRKAMYTLAAAVTVAVVLFSAWMSLAVNDLEAGRKEALKASRAKTDFLANMSHELRTPLNGILGFSELLRMELPDLEQRSFAAAISESGKHLLALVNQFLDLAKIEAGRLEINPQPENMTLLVQAIVASQSSVANNKRLGLEATFAPDLPMAVLCDRLRVTQVLNNLLHNALKFTEAGYISVEVAWASGMLKCAVIDTGPGIDAETQTRLFRKFEQGGGSTALRYSGTGLGLALARELCELMGGRMWVESKVGVGSSFKFTISAPEYDLATHGGHVA
jgi:signal transduction histidine kinase